MRRVQGSGTNPCEGGQAARPPAGVNRQRRRSGWRWRGLIVAGLASACWGAWADGPAPECESLRTQYRAALTQAQACDPKASSPCAVLRPVAVEDPCRCQVSVNPSAAKQLDGLIEAYQTKRCTPEPLVCRRMCPKPSNECGAAAAGEPARCGGKPSP